MSARDRGPKARGVALLNPPGQLPARKIARVLQVQRHRNGVVAEPFHAVLFEATAAVLAAAPGEGARFLGIVFEEAGRVAVICVEPLSSNVGVRFGHNSWRADTFETELREAIDAASASPDGNINILPGAVPTTKERK